MVYEDFLCPFCGQLESTVRDQLDAAVEAGEVNVEYRPLPFLERISDYSPESANAFAVVLDASGPEVAKAFHDLLFDNQPSEEGPFPDADDLVDLAVEAGATEADVRPGIEDMAFEGWVDAADDAASQGGRQLHAVGVRRRGAGRGPDARRHRRGDGRAGQLTHCAA